ncbi:ABC transporter permease [Clostridium sp. ATCC 25772]|uniref:ABC transporter permease n=1 Tax=Clostridium sp. ATCC 25772 TaxID=1676991 RepID=UPI0007825F94|nr:ABC transporter permease [Clostridium sp. ATCC 25772]
MSRMFYLKLAISNIRKNSKTYIPYIITCICSIMMFYIMSSISKNPGLDQVPGSDSLKSMLSFGTVVIGIFSTIFLFYTNSFLIKRRKKEIGLYNVLGLSKKHIAKVLFLENIFIASISFIFGLTSGIILDKFMFLLFLKVLNFPVAFGFYISKISIVRTLILFIGIFFMTLMANLFEIKRSNPTELLKGGQHGEKEPKTKWIMTIIGVVALGAGYGIALYVKSPLSALQLFFTSVILVIIGTYALFTAGSIALLKLLRRNKKFYYKTSNFVSVSGMIYRMKQNAVGLANICILSTAVLVMLSTTVSLYVGVEDVLRNRYPREVLINTSEVEKSQREKIDRIVDSEIKENNIVEKNRVNYLEYTIPCVKEEDKFLVIKDDLLDSDVCFINAVPLSDYNRLENKNVNLGDDEVIIFSEGKKKYGKDSITINDKTYKVKEEIDKLESISGSFTDIVESYIVISKDINNICDLNKKRKGYIVGFDVNGKSNDMITISNKLNKKFDENNMAVTAESIESNKKDFLSLYGGLFFLGIFLGILFLMATVLIIYYKQISEGYDDKERFEIMQKVGMSKVEIKRTIRSQVLMIFFIPITFSVIHIVFAFPIITKLLAVFMLTNVALFRITTLITILVFTIIYFIIFALTTRTYYKIVEE